MFTIAVTPGYLVLTFSGEVDDLQLYEALRSVTGQPELSQKNDLWIFDNCISCFSQTVFPELVRVIGNRHIDVQGRTKTALVTRSGFHNALAELFIEEARQLPHLIRSFFDLDSASAWLEAQEPSTT